MSKTTPISNLYQPPRDQTVAPQGEILLNRKRTVVEDGKFKTVEIKNELPVGENQPYTPPHGPTVKVVNGEEVPVFNEVKTEKPLDKSHRKKNSSNQNQRHQSQVNNYEKSVSENKIETAPKKTDVDLRTKPSTPSTDIPEYKGMTLTELENAHEGPGGDPVALAKLRRTDAWREAAKNIGLDVDGADKAGMTTTKSNSNGGVARGLGKTSAEAELDKIAQQQGQQIEAAILSGDASELVKVMKKFGSNTSPQIQKIIEEKFKNSYGQSLLERIREKYPDAKDPMRRAAENYKLGQTSLGDAYALHNKIDNEDTVGAVQDVIKKSKDGTLDRVVDNYDLLVDQGRIDAEKKLSPKKEPTKVESKKKEKPGKEVIPDSRNVT